MNKRTIILLIILSLAVWKFTTGPRVSLDQLKDPKANIYVTKMHLDDVFLSTMNLSNERMGRVAAEAELGIYYPKGYVKGSTAPVLFTMNPGSGNNLFSINSYKKFADKLGIVLAATHLSASEDVEEARYYYMRAAIEKFKSEGLLADQPVFITGSSGGGKWAMHMGAWLGDLCNGVLAIGVNENLATFGYKQLGNEGALNVPMYMLNGHEDKVAGAHDYNYKPMLWTMKESGFKIVKNVIFEGGHIIPEKETYEALRWLVDRYQSSKGSVT